MSGLRQREPDRPGEATVHRFLDRADGALVVVGDFGSLFAAYLDHVRRWEKEPDGFSQALMRQGLGAASLHLSLRPRGEIVGWTISVRQPATNLFLTGDSGDGTVTGRIFTENVRTSEASRMYVQVSRAGGTPVQSMIEVQGLDVLRFFEQYYEISEQTPARLFEISEVEFLMFLALPEGDPEWFSLLQREEAVAIARSELRALGATTFRFRCGCSAEKMIGVVRSLFRKNPEELFQGDSGVEIYCPRCGRRWWVERERFREGAGG